MNRAIRLGDRSEFEHLQWPVYANFAAISPPSRAVLEAMRAQSLDVATRGSASFGRWLEQRQQLKVLLAQLIGAQPEDLALMANTTSGVAAVALAIDWRPHDQILCFEGEFPANVTPWQQAARRFGAAVQLARLPDPREPCEAWLAGIEQRLARGVRLLAISAVQFQTGWRAPLAEIATLCQRYGTELAVDGVQAVGCVPLDVEALGIDYLACGSHKWLMGPEGCGFLYIRKARLANLHPTQAGWLSHEDPVAFLLRGAGLLRYDRPIRARADWLEGGNVAAAACAGLGAAAALLVELGVAAVYGHVQAWHDRLEPQLRALGLDVLRHGDARHRSGILAVRPSAAVDVVAVQRELADRGVAISIPDGNLRFSAHWPSPLVETDALAGHLADVLRTAQRR